MNDKIKLKYKKKCQEKCEMIFYPYEVILVSFGNILQCSFPLPPVLTHPTSPLFPHALFSHPLLLLFAYMTPPFFILLCHLKLARPR